MRQIRDAAPDWGSARNRWIKSGSPIDLQGMRADPNRQLARALGARAGLRQPTDALPSFDIGP